jgi:beta-mannosidase
MPQALAAHHLTEGWTFKQADDTREDAWLPVARVPTNVHLDLIDNGKYVITCVVGKYLENHFRA